MRTTTKYLSTKELQRFVHTKEIASEMYRIETISPSGEKEIVASWLAGEGLAAYITQLMNEALHTKDIQISK